MTDLSDCNNLIGRTFGTVTLLNMLGKGAKGVVFLGFQTTLKRRVAVKLIPRLKNISREAREDFLFESEILAGLSHPNIIPIFEIGEEEDYYYQIMQLVDGFDIEVLIKNVLKYPVPSKRFLPLSKTLPIMISILDGLHYAHNKGIVHQDIKPANVLIEKTRGRPLIVDFGIAKKAEREVASNGYIAGSPLYISPEQASGKATDRRSDVYSAGVLLFKMVCSTIPRNRESAVELLKRKIFDHDTFFTAKPSDISPEVDSAIDEIIFKSTSSDPVCRFQSCDEFASALRKYGNDKGIL